LAVLIFICVLQCAYVLPTRKVENDATNYASEIAAKVNDPAQAYEIEKLEKRKYLDSLSREEIFSIPGIKSYTFDELKGQQLAYGLDLSGGISAVLQVDLKEMLTTLSRNSKDPTFTQALADADLALTNSQSDYITLFGDAFRKVKGNKKLANFFHRSLNEEVALDATDGEVITVLRQKANETVNLTFNLLKQRIDKMGTTQPNIQLDAARDLILVELPGVDNPDRAEKMLQASARLEFWDVYQASDPGVLSAFVEADRLLKNQQSLDGSQGLDTEEVIAYDTIRTPEVDDLGNATGDTLEEYVRRDVDQFADQGPLLSMLTLNRATNNVIQYARPVMGVANRNKKNAIDEMLKRPEIAALFPTDSKLLWAQNPYKDPETFVETKLYELYMIKKRAGSDNSPLEGDRITSAGQSPDPTTGEIKVNLTMDMEGARIWKDMTTIAANDNNREVAIALDDEVISAPSVRGPIPGGRTEISGNFSIEEASDLASMLEIGKLPARVKIVQSANVGPSLGKENIRRSALSLLVGLSLLLVFIIAYYGGAGFVTIIALLANIAFIFAALASFGTVLTLPGIAGIVLTIGMAVDANVIIFERVKEELRAGKSLLAAINDGFKNSYSAIIDANVTTLLVAIVLAYYGLGVIKGFAVVLIIGVLMSLFTAVLLGRLIIDWWTQSRGNHLSFWTPMSKNFLANLQIDWIGKRKIAYVISGFFIAAGLISMFTNQFDYGVDFTGGYAYNVEFQEGVDVDIASIRAGLAESFGSEPSVKAVDSRNTFNIVTDYAIEDQSEGASARAMEALHQGINSIVGGNLPLETFKMTDAVNATHVTSSSKVGPTIADDIKNSSFKAGIFALLLIFLYIFLRFNKWQYSLGAVAALFHDTLIVLGMFSLLYKILPIPMEIDQTFIAAILTVIGYSINDTVVVFDRIREYLGIYTNKTKDEVLNLAINSTFSRTLITSLTTLLMVVILLIFGGSSTKGFALAVTIGVIVGTYSSIFVATPIVRDLTNELRSNKTEKKKKSFSRAVKA